MTCARLGCTWQEQQAREGETRRRTAASSATCARGLATKCGRLRPAFSSGRRDCSWPHGLPPTLRRCRGERKAIGPARGGIGAAPPGPRTSLPVHTSEEGGAGCGARPGARRPPQRTATAAPRGARASRDDAPFRLLPAKRARREEGGAGRPGAEEQERPDGVAGAGAEADPERIGQRRGRDERGERAEHAGQLMSRHEEPPEQERQQEERVRERHRGLRPERPGQEQSERTEGTRPEGDRHDDDQRIPSRPGMPAEDGDREPDEEDRLDRLDHHDRPDLRDEELAARQRRSTQPPEDPVGALEAGRDPQVDQPGRDDRSREDRWEDRVDRAAPGTAVAAAGSTGRAAKKRSRTTGSTSVTKRFSRRRLVRRSSISRADAIRATGEDGRPLPLRSTSGVTGRLTRRPCPRRRWPRRRPRRRSCR
jgi:hypothetical protein